MNIFLDLQSRKFVRNNVFYVAEVQPATTKGDGAGRDEIKATFLLEDCRIGSASKGPELEEDVRAVGVNGIRRLTQ